MPSGVPNEQVDFQETAYCKYCYQPVVRIKYTGTAGRGDIRPYKHLYNRSPLNVEICHRATLSEDDVTDSTPWD
jgi:hypothetical protein